MTVNWGGHLARNISLVLVRVVSHFPSSESIIMFCSGKLNRIVEHCALCIIDLAFGHYGMRRAYISFYIAVVGNITESTTFITWLYVCIDIQEHPFSHKIVQTK